MQNSFKYRDFDVTVMVLANSAQDGRPWTDLKPTTFSFAISLIDPQSGESSCPLAPKNQLSPHDALRQGEEFAKAHIDDLLH
ncbi:MAG: hypothetical protein QM639_17770 [Rhodocyclaceae bacterium]